MAQSTRSDVLRRALEACLVGDVDALPELFTDDASVWSPNMLATSLGELAEAVGDRDGSLSDVNLQIDALDVVGNKGFVEYRVSAVFSGPFVLDEDRAIEPNGQTILIGAALVADFDGDKIAALRNYFDDSTLMEQMLLT
ncbi:MAG TPA: nuclear transport factor 2 family protein [Actinomycetes bacterium]